MKLVCKNKEIDINMIIVSYILIFGIKINTYYDITIIFEFLYLFYSICTKRIIFRRRTILMMSGLIIIICWILIVSLVNDRYNIIYFAKFVRSILSILTISIYINHSHSSKNSKINSIIIILLIHALIVIFSSTFFINLQLILNRMSGTRLIMPYRSIGLTTGYDFSGTICLIGANICYFRPYERKRNSFYNFSLIVFTISLFFTSRFTILSFAFTLVLWFVFSIKNKVPLFNKYYLIVAMFFTFIVGLFIVFISIDVFKSFTFYLNSKGSIFSKISENYIYSYAASNLASTTIANYDFKELSKIEFFFGSMKNVFSDPGYTLHIYKIGLFGVFLIISWYASFALHIFKNLKKYNGYNKDLLYSILITILYTIILSLKNDYLFASFIFELMLLLYYTYDFKEKEVQQL